MWKERYLLDVFASANNEQLISRGIQLKNERMPQMLYKYRPASERNIDALFNGVVYSVTPQLCNDLNECPLSFDKIEIERNMLLKIVPKLSNEDITMLCNISKSNSISEIVRSLSAYQDSEGEMLPDELSKEIRQKHLENREMIDQMIDSFYSTVKNSYNIYCLSENYCDDLMWAHYADNHAGYCLGYKVKDFSSAIIDVTLPVIYTDKYVIIKDLDLVDGVTSMYALTLKKKCWEYECEWRIFYPLNSPFHPESMPLPSVIYLGNRITDENKKTISDFCKSKSIQIQQMALDKATHKLIATIID